MVGLRLGYVGLGCWLNRPHPMHQSRECQTRDGLWLCLGLGSGWVVGMRKSEWHNRVIRKKVSIYGKYMKERGKLENNTVVTTVMLLLLRL